MISILRKFLSCFYEMQIINIPDERQFERASLKKIKAN